MAEDACPLVILLVVWVLWVIVLHDRQLDHSSAIAIRQRLLKPRTPHDCPACRRQRALPPSASVPPPVIRPWSEFKRQRGAPRRITTDGFACPTPACPYYRITDAQIHALVGDGRHGKHERIQTFRCQACGATFTSRRDTPL